MALSETMKCLTFLAVLCIVSAACGLAGGKLSAPSRSQRPDFAPLVEGQRSPDGLQAILGTADLGVGRHRVAFLLNSTEGIVDVPLVSVSSRYLRGEGSESLVREMMPASFHLWPVGTRGLYITWLTFDQAGRWALDIQVRERAGNVLSTSIAFPVAERPMAPIVGSPAPRSKSKTLAGVRRFEEVTTGSLHDPDLYRISIANAAASGNPTVITFASPAFCTNAVCGPQLDVLQELKNKYRQRANFIHVDFYDNPQEIQGDLRKARISSTVLEWKLPSIEWSFVLDRHGKVAARFEAFATFQELETELLKVL